MRLRVLDLRVGLVVGPEPLAEERAEHGGVQTIRPDRPLDDRVLVTLPGVA